MADGKTPLLWDLRGAYRGECAAWLHTIIGLGVSLPAMVSMSDMSIEGNPLIFVNDTFCSATGYTRAEALGSNCRFLQGPATEASSIGIMAKAMVECTDCVVKLTNFKKSGEPFPILVALRPLIDATKARRFCVALHFELTPDKPVKTLVAKVAKLMKLLPSQVPFR